MKNPGFLILGCGPIGGIFAASISGRAGRVTIADANEPHVRKIRKDGLKVIFERETKVVCPAACYTSLEDAKGDVCDYLVVALKTPAMEKVIPPAARLVSKGTKIISLQNGIGTEDFLAEYFGRERVFRIVVNYAGAFVEPGIVKQGFFHPPNYLGACTEKNIGEAEKLSEFLTVAGCRTEFTKKIEKYEWAKSGMNAAMGSVSAVTGLNMKEAMELGQTRNIITKILEEIIRTAAAKGVALEDNYLEDSLHYLEGAGPHLPSMRLDLLNKQQTEINFLNQKILDAANQFKIPVPFLECITCLIRGIK